MFFIRECFKELLGDEDGLALRMVGDAHRFGGMKIRQDRYDDRTHSHYRKIDRGPVGHILTVKRHFVHGTDTVGVEDLLYLRNLCIQRFIGNDIPIYELNGRTLSVCAGAVLKKCF